MIIGRRLKNCSPTQVNFLRRSTNITGTTYLKRSFKRWLPSWRQISSSLHRRLPKPVKLQRDYASGSLQSTIITTSTRRSNHWERILRRPTQLWRRLRIIYQRNRLYWMQLSRSVRTWGISLRMQTFRNKNWKPKLPIVKLKWGEPSSWPAASVESV